MLLLSLIFIGKSATVTRRNRDIVPKCRARSDTPSEPTPAAKKTKISVDSNTVPSKTWVVEQQKHVHYPLAQRTIALEVCEISDSDIVEPL